MNSLSQRFLDFSAAFRNSAPLYSRLASRVAHEPQVLDLMKSADAAQRIPVLLFASVHFLLLSRPDDALAEQYRRYIDAPSGPQADWTDIDDSFIAFISRNASELRNLMATRTTQTNEVGRCSWFLFPFAEIEREVGDIARIDVGSSAGLTLLFPCVGYRISPADDRSDEDPQEYVLGTTSKLVLNLQTRGLPPRLHRLPRVVWSKGFDADPIDIFDHDHVHWLEACVWPEQIERFGRLVAAIDLVREKEIEVVAGDAVEDLRSHLEEASAHGHPVVTTSWVLNYLSPDRRRAFVDQLNDIGSAVDLSWVIAESPRDTPELPGHEASTEDITVISLVRWRKGVRTSRRLATAHPHGTWINWMG